MRTAAPASRLRRGRATQSSRRTLRLEDYWAVQPPSTGRIVPFTIAPASDAR